MAEWYKKIRNFGNYTTYQCSRGRIINIINFIILFVTYPPNLAERYSVTISFSSLLLLIGSNKAMRGDLPFCHGKYSVTKTVAILLWILLLVLITLLIITSKAMGGRFAHHRIFGDENTIEFFMMGADALHLGCTR
jgi:hypothetical protein